MGTSPWLIFCFALSRLTYFAAELDPERRHQPILASLCRGGMIFGVLLRMTPVDVLHFLLGTRKSLVLGGKEHAT